MVFGELLSGQDLVIKHSNVVKDLPSKGLKEYAPNHSWLEGKQIEKQLEERFDFVKAVRIEKSNNLSQAQWVPHLKKAKVTKKLGKSWETLGHHQDNEDWLLPEEALFLLENSELQLFCDNVSLSLEDCYLLVFNEGGCSLEEYRVFSYLSRTGMRVVRHCPSVSVTRYEKQVRLDSVVQAQKRPPPEATNGDVTIIDDDISIVGKLLQEPPSKLPKKGSAAVPINEESIILIESDDDDDDVEVITTGDSDSDSDVVCISSPSYVPDKNSREWYPPAYKCLRRTMDILIDLSDDEKSVFRNVRNRFDLIRPSKQAILLKVPNVKGGLTHFVVEDSRLLPPNITPKFAEYRINLSIREDYHYRNRSPYGALSGFRTTTGQYSPPDFRSTTDEYGATSFRSTADQYGPPALLSSPSPAQSLAYGSNSGFNNFGANVMNQNPLFMQAQQMQAMAVNMLKTAATLMSAMASASQNPNELWQVCENGVMMPGGSAVMPFQGPRYGAMTNFRGYSGPRRPRPYNKFPRRRFPYNRRPWGNRRNFAQPSADVVVLSDGSESEKSFSECRPSSVQIDSEPENGKRKANDYSDTNKRIKQEQDNNLDNVTVSDSSSCIMENTAVNIKKENESVVGIKTEAAEPHTKAESSADALPSNVKTEPQDLSIKKEVDRSIKKEADLSVKKEPDLSIKKEPDPSIMKECNVKIKEESHPSVKNEPTDKPSASNPPESPQNVGIAGESNSKLSDSANKPSEELNQERLIPLSIIHGQPQPSIFSPPRKDHLSISEEPKPVQNDNVFPPSGQRGDPCQVIAEANVAPEMTNNSLNEETLKPEACNDSGFQNSSTMTKGKIISENTKSTNEETPIAGASKDSEISAINNGIISWEQYKSTVDLEEDDSILKIDDCVTYGDVLSTLKIFKPLEVERVTKKIKISFDVYLPDSNFKKSLKILPNYRVIVLKPSDNVPSSFDIEGLKKEYQDNIPFLFSIVFSETIGFYMCSTVSLDTLID